MPIAQFNLTVKKEHNYIANGFLASSKAQEPCADLNKHLHSQTT
ncbi:hypothetical protein HWQ46_08865 [Shewanella sp. D64]|nr:MULTISPECIES: hypothetical protein [unclassified Shewanella]MEC4725650.1 hypothetical protein [Shewanella sp. D64]MEC4739702.1 hypothetical protein [Shewanella sp. E94]WBJ94835.1 hypothetical protein HWQ47_23830 [Shewanella sp. MTB7]